LAEFTVFHELYVLISSMQYQFLVEERESGLKILSPTYAYLVVLCICFVWWICADRARATPVSLSC